MTAAWAWVVGLLNLVGGRILDEAHRFATMAGLNEQLHEYAALYPSCICLLWIVFAFLYVFRREWRLPLTEDSSLSVALVVPAHNEELTIARTIESLLAQDYPNAAIHVVSDGSTDRTAEIARRYDSRGVVVHDLQPNRGKSGALQYALDHVEADLFMVVDADTIAEPNAIRYMVQQMADPRIAGVTGSPRVRNVTNLLTAMQAMEYAVIISLAKRAESFWGGLYTVSGAAACFRTHALRDVGGWSGETATEDIEISWRLQKAGYRLAYEPRALFHIQTPAAVRTLYRQRVRWAQGMLEVLRIHANLLSSRNAAILPIGLQVVATAIWVEVVILSLIQGAWALAFGGSETWMAALQGLGLGPLWSAIALTECLFLAQATAACTFDSHYKPGSMKFLPLAIIYPLYFWLLVAPCFVVGCFKGLFSRHSGRWARSARVRESA